MNTWARHFLWSLGHIRTRRWVFLVPFCKWDSGRLNGLLGTLVCVALGAKSQFIWMYRWCAFHTTKQLQGMFIQLVMPFLLKEEMAQWENTEPRYIRQACRKALVIIFLVSVLLKGDIFELQPIPRELSSLLWLLGGVSRVALIESGGVTRRSRNIWLAAVFPWAPLGLFC